MILASDLGLLLNCSVGKCYSGVSFKVRCIPMLGKYAINLYSPDGEQLDVSLTLSNDRTDICVGSTKLSIPTDIELIKQFTGLYVLPRYVDGFNQNLLGYAEVIGEGMVGSDTAYLLRIGNGAKALVSKDTLRELAKLMKIRGVLTMGRGVTVSNDLPLIGIQRAYSYCWR